MLPFGRIREYINVACVPWSFRDNAAEYPGRLVLKRTKEDSSVGYGAQTHMEAAAVSECIEPTVRVRLRQHGLWMGWNIKGVLNKIKI